MGFLTLAAGNWFVEAWNTMWLLVCQGIYVFIGILYRIFESVASVNLFSRDILEKLTGRIYVVVGIAMLFIFAYNLVLTIINPEDKKGTGGMTSVVKETIISLVMVILLPTVFNWLCIFQSHVLETNIIGTIVFGGVGSSSGGDANNPSQCAEDDYDCTCDFSDFNLDSYNNTSFFLNIHSTTDKTKFLTESCKAYQQEKASVRGARTVGPTIFSAFYIPTNFTFDDCVNYLKTGDGIEDDTDQKICVNYFYDVTAAKYTGNVGPFVSDSYLKDLVSEFKNDKKIELHWIMAILAGGMALYIFFCYAMEIGVRVAKLGFLQMIAPIPVMLRIIPGQKEKVYAKWMEQLRNTYLDVFIRVAIIYFALFAVSLVPGVLDTIFSNTFSGSDNFIVKAVATAIIILGILKFGGDAPALFKDLFALKGNFAVKSPRKQFNENKVAKGAVGMVSGGALGLASNIYNTSQNVKNIKNDDEDNKGLRTAGAAVGGVFSGAGGLVGGARAGATRGYNSQDGELGQEILRAAEDNQTNREKHKATREKGAINGHEIPVVSSAWGSMQNAYSGVSNSADSVWGAIKGEGPSQASLEAGEELLKQFEKFENQFSDKVVEALKNAYLKTQEDYNSGKDISIDGYKYTREGDNWVSRDKDGKVVKSVSHEAMLGDIKKSFNSALASAYAENYKKDSRSVEVIAKSAFETLSKNLPAMGKEFSDKMLSKVSDGLEKLAGIDKKFENFDQLSDFYEELQDKFKKLDPSDAEYDKKSKEIFRQLYAINDSIKGSVKENNKYNMNVAQANKEKKEQKDKK